ncbi:MAG: exodeoxyribonuclease VII large subunit [Bdellovibrionota bacterium]
MDLFEYSKAAKDPSEKESDQEKVFSVQEITLEIKDAIKQSISQHGKIWIRGELSNFKGKNQSGHMYFRLKDEHAVIACVFFRFSNAKLTFDLKEGQEVLASGKIDVWDKGGNYQLVVDEIRLAGQGQLFQKFEELKKKLHAEGLFDPRHKKTLPPCPRNVAVVTSSTGSVIKDILHVTSNRFPFVTISLFPVKVQGETAAGEIALALDMIEKNKDQFDAIVVGRGGGSIEDLWPFNEEIVARKIFASSVPVISAVGHQTDFTICDFVADVRAATPSHAAEMMVPDLRDLKAQIRHWMESVVRELSHRKSTYRQTYLHLIGQQVLKDPKFLLSNKMQQLDRLHDDLVDAAKDIPRKKKEQFVQPYRELAHVGKSFMQKNKATFEKIKSNLDMLNPLSILSRGYSIVKTKNSQIIKSSHQVEERQDIEVVLYEGSLECEIKKISSNA